MLPLQQLDAMFFETAAILKRVASASRRLAELKGLATSIPRQSILINTLTIQEAKDSSEIENIVTTHDEPSRTKTPQPSKLSNLPQRKSSAIANFSGKDSTLSGKASSSLTTTCS